MKDQRGKERDNRRADAEAIRIMEDQRGGGASATIEKNGCGGYADNKGPEREEGRE
jgi:hypothetical protein